MTVAGRSTRRRCRGTDRPAGTLRRIPEHCGKLRVGGSRSTHTARNPFMDSRKDHKGPARIGLAWVDRLVLMRRSPADLEVTVACSSTSDPQKRYPRDVGGDPDRCGSTRPEIAMFVSQDTNIRRYRRRRRCRRRADRRDLVRTGRQDRERATGGERRESPAVRSRQSPWEGVLRKTSNSYSETVLAAPTCTAL